MISLRLLAMLCLFLLCCSTLCFTNGTCHAAECVVTSTLDDGSAGTLRYCVEHVISGDVIGFNIPGDGQQTIQLSSGQLQLAVANVQIWGPGSDKLIIQAAAGSRVFDLLYSSILIRDLTIANGNPTGDVGGGIKAQGSLTLTNCVVTNNAATTGGGIWFSADDTETLNIQSCEISSNTASPSTGGGILLSSGKLSLTNSTISNNTSSNYGGGVKSNHNGVAQLTNTSFGNNTGLYGGALYYSSDGSMVIDTCDFTGNETTSGTGGAIYFTSASSMYIKQSTFSSNTSASYGGAIQATGYVTLEDSSFVGNHCLNNTGGACNLSESSVSGCLFSGNISDGAAGAISYSLDASDSCSLMNTTIHGNSAVNNGGGVTFYSSESPNAYIAYCTITGNTGDSNGDSTGDGGGIWQGGSVNPVMKSCVVADNHTGQAPILANQDCLGAFTSQGYNFIGVVNGQTGFANGVNGDQVGTDVAPLDPSLQTLADNGGSTQTLAPQRGSPVIDAGGPATGATGNPVTVDQRGETRPQGKASDVGAYEASTTSILTIPMTLLLNDAS